MPLVALPKLTGLQAAAWDALTVLAPQFGENWTLIGGQMVFLHQAERDHSASPSLRWTTDLDVVVNLRTSPAGLAHVHSVLTRSGFGQLPQQIEHRYRRDADSVTVDVLAPDHLGDHLPRLGGGHTVQAPGSTQALRRTEWVNVAHAGRDTLIPRPDLIGALLIKQAAAQAAPGGRRPNRHRSDVLVLASMLRNSDIDTARLTANERRLMHNAHTDIAAQADTAQAEAVAARLQRLTEPTQRTTDRSDEPTESDSPQTR